MTISGKNGGSHVDYTNEVWTMQTLEELIEQAQHLPLKDRKQLIEVLEASLVEETAREATLTSQEEFRQRYPHITIDPDLFALVGIQAENVAEEDKALIREQVFRRLAE